MTIDCVDLEFEPVRWGCSEEMVDDGSHRFRSDAVTGWARWWRSLSTRQPEDWRWLAHRRAATERFDTFDAYLDRIESRDDVVRTGVSAIADQQVDLVVHERHLDVYVSATVAADIVTTMRLEPRFTGNLTLRAIPEIEEAGYIMNRRSMPRSVIAVDLLEDTDERTARTGSDMIRAILDGR